MATSDNGLAAVLYSASAVTAKAGDGETVTINCDSEYPFEDELKFTFSMEKDVKFPLYLRIPGWCNNAMLEINGKTEACTPEAGKYLKITRTWKKGDRIRLTLPMKLNITKWEANHNSVSVNYGPLTFSLMIRENFIRKESTATSQHDSKWQKNADVSAWPSWEIMPGSPWNYGLILDNADPDSLFTIVRKDWPADSYPFTIDAVPLTLLAKGKRIPEWTIDETGLTGELKNSLVKSEEPVEEIELIPMGAARLRISSFPVIGEGESANSW